MVLGPVATVLLLVADGAAGIGATALLACVDAATFMLWLCFFGHMKVGETALYVALSYAAGALLCLVVMNMESGAASACAAVLPVLSGCSFLLSNRFYAQQTGSPAMFSEEAAETGESETVFPYMNRMACALALYALLFGLATSTAVCNGIGGPYTGPYIEAPCCLALGVLLALVSRSPKHAHKLYLAYRFIPLLFALGFAALLFSDDRTFVVASTCIMLAYLTFEITSLNDFCNAVKAGGLSLVRMFGIARLAITGGMLAGWLLGFGSSLLPPGMPPVPFAVALGAVALVAASTLVFTEKEVFAVRGVADERHSAGERRPRERGGRRLRRERGVVRAALGHVEARDGGARPAAERPQHALHLPAAVHCDRHREDAHLQHLPKDGRAYQDGTARLVRHVLLRERARRPVP